MAVNLVEMVMQYLTPDRIGRIAAVFNLNSKSAQSVAEVLFRRFSPGSPASRQSQAARRRSLTP